LKSLYSVKTHPHTRVPGTAQATSNDRQ